jgi:hypothetical protein
MSAAGMILAAAAGATTLHVDAEAIARAEHTETSADSFDETELTRARLGVALDLDGRKLLPMFLEVRGLAYPVGLADERMLHGETPFGPVRAIPATFLVDADGRHVETFQGVVPFAHLQARLDALIAARP